MLQAIVGNASAEKVQLFLAGWQSGYAREIAQTADMNHIHIWMSSEGSAICACVLLAKPSPQSTDD
jgi:hypothetical protein